MPSETLKRAGEFRGVTWEDVDRVLAQLDLLETESGIDPDVFSRWSEFLTDERRGLLLLNPFHLAETPDEDLYEEGLEVDSVALIAQVLFKALEIAGNRQR